MSKIWKLTFVAVAGIGLAAALAGCTSSTSSSPHSGGEKMSGDSKMGGKMDGDTKMGGKMGDTKMGGDTKTGGKMDMK
jgi:hypothetical protein